MSSPFKRINGKTPPAPAAPQAIAINKLSDISEEDWPNARAQFVSQNIAKEFTNAPAYQNVQPVVMPRVNAQGQTLGVQLLAGLRKREHMTVEFVAAAIAASIRNPGVIGQHRPIPEDPIERKRLVQAAMDLADTVLIMSVQKEMEDVKELQQMMAESMDRQRAGELAVTASGTSHVKMTVLEDEPTEA